MSQLPLLVSDPAKQAWFWQAAVIAVGILLALNLVFIAVVYLRRLRELVRDRRAESFRTRFEPILDDVASGAPGAQEELRREIGELGELERPIAASMLLERLKPASPEERAAMLDLLREAGAIEPMLRGTRRWRPWRRALTLRTLGWLGATEGVPAALERLKDRNRYVREASVRALGRIGDERALLPLENIYLDPDRKVASGFAYEAVVAFGLSAEPVFRQGLQSSDERIRVSSCFGIAAVLEPERCRPLLEQMLDDRASAVRAAASELLGRVGGDQVPAELARASRDYQQSVRRAAATALGSYDDPRALELLLGCSSIPTAAPLFGPGSRSSASAASLVSGAEAREAVEKTDAWPLERAQTLAALGEL